MSPEVEEPPTPKRQDLNSSQRAEGNHAGTSHVVWRSHIDDARLGFARFLPVAEAHLYRALGSVYNSRVIALAA
jgi:hypothetical protein